MPPTPTSSPRSAALSRLAASGKGGGSKGFTLTLGLLCTISVLYATMAPKIEWKSSASSPNSETTAATTTPSSSVRGAGGGIDVKETSRLSASSSSSSSSSLPTTECYEGMMGIDTSRQLVSLDAEKIKNFGNRRLHEVKHLTVERYEPYLTGEAGLEHYTLLHYLTDNYGDCRHVVDIGTRYIASSLALGSSKNHPVPVWTFDVPDSIERVEAYRGKTEEEWQQQAKALGLDITFYNLNLATIPIEEFLKYMSTWLVSLDTHHLPKTVPFEREFFARLKEVNYTGLLMLDDIYLNKEMKEWWEELLEDSKASGLFSVYDMTPVGHHSGTGLLDFSPNHADRSIVDHKMVTII